MRIKKTKSQILFNIISYSSITLVAIFCLFPLVLIVSGSFTENEVLMRHNKGEWERRNIDMSKSVIIAGAGDETGRKLVHEFLDLGWNVYAGYRADDARIEAGEHLVCFGFDPTDHFNLKAAQKKVGTPVDMLVVNINSACGAHEVDVYGTFDYQMLLNAYDERCIGALRVINVFLPLLEQGKGKRICVVTTADSSINNCTDTFDYAKRLSSASLNMAMTQLFNGLRPNGYSFRMYCRDESGGDDAWMTDYFIRDRSYEPEDLKHSDEQRIVLRDWMSRELPW